MEELACGVCGVCGNFHLERVDINKQPHCFCGQYPVGLRCVRLRLLIFWRTAVKNLFIALKFPRLDKIRSFYQCSSPSTFVIPGAYRIILLAHHEPPTREVIWQKVSSRFSQKQLSVLFLGEICSVSPSRLELLSTSIILIAIMALLMYE